MPAAGNSELQCTLHYSGPGAATPDRHPLPPRHQSERRLATPPRPQTPHSALKHTHLRVRESGVGSQWCVHLPRWRTWSGLVVGYLLRVKSNCCWQSSRGSCHPRKQLDAGAGDTPAPPPVWIYLIPIVSTGCHVVARPTALPAAAVVVRRRRVMLLLLLLPPLLRLLQGAAPPRRSAPRRHVYRGLRLDDRHGCRVGAVCHLCRCQAVSRSLSPVRLACPLSCIDPGSQRPSAGRVSHGHRPAAAACGTADTGHSCC